MPELLLEIFSEEIPARMQAGAAKDLSGLVVDALSKAGMEVGTTQAFATPRRLALHIPELPAMSPSVSEDRKGPRVSAPGRAIEGFMRSAGLNSIDEADVVEDPKRGNFYVARIKRPGRKVGDIIAEVIPDVVRKFPWPKSMRWGEHQLRWVRPIHRILCLLDGHIVAFEVDKIKSGAKTEGHRFMAQRPFSVEGFADYCSKLKAHKVMLDVGQRAREIEVEAHKLADSEGLELIEDVALLRENSGLVEWPVVKMGTFDQGFLEVPSDVLITSMKVHQKCFSLWDPRVKRLANKFILVSNLSAKDRGQAIINGNERVIRARLADAKFFWEQDLKTPIETLVPKLDGVTFHERLGSQGQRVARLTELAVQIAASIDADPTKTERASHLAKADLLTGMVGEFPELQGLMGRYYATAQGEHEDVACAIKEHYLPQGPGDPVPTNPISIAVALSDKLNTLVGFWVINEKPTGSKDPFALRRAALGIIRILVENEMKLSLTALMRALALKLTEEEGEYGLDEAIAVIEQLPISLGKTQIETFQGRGLLEDKFGKDYETRLLASASLVDDLLSFFADRLKVYLRDQGVRHDLIDAVLALGDQDDILLIVKRVKALGRFLDSDDGINLLMGVKRAQNILRIEEKKDKTKYDGAFDAEQLLEQQEQDLAKMIELSVRDAEAAIAMENFEGAMAAMARLRTPVDAFFDNVTVNVENRALRENRLRLLSQIRAATMQVADFARIAG